MKLPRRQVLHLTAGAVALPAVSRVARAQTYPTRPVRILVGFAAGQAIDIIVRVIAQWLSDQLGQQFVVENRPGAGFAIWALGRKVRAGKRNGSQRLRARQKKTHSGGQIDLEKA